MNTEKNSGNGRHRLLKKSLAGFAVTAFWLAVWQGLSMLFNSQLTLPSPLQVLTALWGMMQTLSFWQAAALSLLRVLAGFVAAVAAGCALALLTEHVRAARALLSPVLHVVRAAPVASFILLALMWIPSGRLPAFIAFVMVVPVVWENVAKGLRHTDRGLLEMARVYRFGALKTLRLVRVPSVMPYLLAACTTGLGFAWKSAIAAEIIARPLLSIGSRMQDAKTYLEYPTVFALTVVVILLSLLLERLLLWAAKRYDV